MRATAPASMPRSRLYYAGRDDSVRRITAPATGEAPLDDTVAPLATTSQPGGSARTVSVNLSLRPRLPRFLRRGLRFWRQRHTRVSFATMAVIVMVAEIVPLVHLQPGQKVYALGGAEGLLPAYSTALEKKLQYDGKEAAYRYNAGYKPNATNQASIGGPQITAVAYDDPTKGVQVTDPVNQIDFGMKPKFDLLRARKDHNRIIYPLSDGTGWLVYTMQGIRVKEDVLLTHANGDTMTMPYELALDNGLEARQQKDGSIGVFGTSLPVNGNVSTGSDKDAKLLEKMRQKAKKDQLLFTIPRPVVFEQGQTKSNVQVTYELKGKELKVVARGLRKAHYPLTIDPSIYIETASKFMRANNESNIDFDTTNELIQKGTLTGGSIESWSATGMTALQAGRWNQATAVGGGFVYSVGGKNNASNQSDVYWAKFDTSSKAITSPTPGTTGVCTNWCTSADYNLPAARSALSSVVYNGYLYAVGGLDSSCTSGNGTGNNGFCRTVYVAKLGVNGEPQLWRPTTASSYAYWYRAGNLSTERAYSGLVAYQNRLYLVGGQTSATPNGVTTVEYADVNPNGTLGTWSTSGMTALAAARWGHTTLQYNGYLYVVGGGSGGTLTNEIRYIKINSDGSLASSWVLNPGTSFGTARASLGGTFATIWGGYMYITGGCSTATVVGGVTNCSAFPGSPNNALQMASMNADGSVSDWTVISGVTLSRIGYGLVAWRNTLYTIGGCAVATASANCSSPQTATAMGTIEAAGEVGPNDPQTSFSSLTHGRGDNTIGRIGGGVAINDGYIYYVGGCSGTTNGCNTNTELNDNAAYAPISVDGTIGAWTYANNVINSSVGIAAISANMVAYNNALYIVGGYVGTGTHSDNIYRSAIDVTGTHAPGVFAVQTGGLPSGYSWAGVTARSFGNSGGFLYVMGGCAGLGLIYNSFVGSACSGSFQRSVLRCPITNSTGAVGACTNNTAWQLPDIERTTTGSNEGIGAFGFGVWGEYVYIVGGVCGLNGINPGEGAGQAGLENGCDATSGGDLNQTNSRHIYYSKFDSTGGLTKPPDTANCGSTGNANIDNTVWCKSGRTLNMARRVNSALAVNGYLYVAGGQQNVEGTQTPLTDVELAKLDPDTGDIAESFTTLSQNGSTDTITGGWGAGFVANSGYMYLIAGCQTGSAGVGCTSAPGAVDKMQVYNNYSGSPRSYAATTVTGLTDRFGASVAAYDGYLYVAGGCTTTTDCTTYSREVSYAPIAGDGTVGTWTSSTTTFGLPANRAFGCMAAVGGYLYFMGGASAATSPNNARPEVYYSQLSSGVPGAWSTASGGIGDTSSLAAQSRYNPDCAVYNNRIYVSGGSDTANAYSSSIYITPSLASGGNILANTWTQATNSFTTGRSGHVMVAYGNSLYILGGFDGTNYLMDTQYAPIDATGDVGAWKYGATLPRPIRQGSGFAANGYLYIFGGRRAATTCSNDTLTAPLIGYAPGTTTRNGIGAWSQSNVTYTGTRYGLGAAFYEGRAYVVGGMCNGALTGANRVVQGTLLSQPQKSVYSIMIDADTDVFPTYWLLNGVDNGSSAPWNLQYKSSTDEGSSCATMTTWGQATTKNTIQLGYPGTYTPKDGSGVNTNCTRYFFLSLTVDATQSFGYAEDYSRGPNIADLTLYFTSDPSKRLMHGRTFTGGQQQPLDTAPVVTSPQ